MVPLSMLVLPDNTRRLLVRDLAISKVTNLDGYRCVYHGVRNPVRECVIPFRSILMQNLYSCFLGLVCD